MNWIKTEDLSRFTDQFKPQLIHPDDPRWLKFWREMKRRCIEGAWFEDFGGWRYGRGNLGFYHHYCRIPDVDKVNKTHGKLIRPLIRDLEWHYSYNVGVARGFSGFSEDDKYTSDFRVFNINKTKFPEDNELCLYKSDGTFKEFIEPLENIARIHDNPVGIPLYNNDAKNIVVLGARGGGKSLYHILAEVFYDITFDGAKVYNEQIIRNPNQILINVGAGIKGKSAKTLAFMKISSNFLKTSPEAGTWGKIGDDDWEPCPFYKEMTGSFDTDDERGWTNKFSVKVGSAWEERGTGSTVYHVSYSANKRTGAESGAGGRRSLIMYEEIGLFEDLLNAWGSDEAVVSVDGVQFAPRIGVGTSGNIHTIKAAQKIFTHPDDYNCIGYKGKDGEKHCFFLPAYIVDKRFKDKNGNTNLAKAKKYYDDKLEEKLRTNDPAIINNWKMNYPTEIEHMWIASEGQLLPGKEAELREKQLLKNNLYESIGTPISLFWDNNHPDGVNYEVDPTAYPIYDDNLQDKESLEGAVMMYEQPFRINGKIPIDAHIFTHDPYVSDAFDEGGSLGVTHVWINPKYIPYGAKGNCLAATYIGKNKNGLDGYNQVLEKMLAFYGNPMRQLWYESNRGDRLRSHFIKKNKAYLLCLQPQFEQGQHIYLKNTTKTGFVVGSQVSKISMLDRLNDWLLEETDINDEVEKNIFRIPCIFTIRQIRDYTLKGNYDAVSSMMGLPLALGEIEHNIKEGLSRQNNPFSKMSKFLKQRIGQ